MTMKDEMSLLRATGAEVELLDSGCCGMAGPFGFEKDKFEVRKRWPNVFCCPASALLGKTIFWSATALVAASRSSRTRRAQPSTWPRCLRAIAEIRHDPTTPRRRNMNQIDLKNRHAVVTGGAQGIGFAIAQRLVASGASVSLWDRDADLLNVVQKRLNEGSASTEVVDVADPDSVNAAAESTASKHGSIDILVANAGIAGPNHKTWEYPLDAWKQVMDINLTGVFLCCRAIVPYMLRQDYGRIVNIASIAGKEGNPTASAYSASKAGVIALTKSLGKETATKNIAVNCITPAAARTRIFEQISAGAHRLHAVTHPAWPFS